MKKSFLAMATLAAAVLMAAAMPAQAQVVPISERSTFTSAKDAHAAPVVTLTASADAQAVITVADALVAPDTASRPVHGGYPGAPVVRMGLKPGGNGWMLVPQILRT